MKSIFDRLPSFMADKYNSLITELDNFLQSLPIPVASEIIFTPNSGIISITVQDAIEEVNTNIAGSLKLVSAPDTTTSVGTAGDFAISGDYIYLCTATNTWCRTQVTGTW